jgi:hypothetical protein
LITGRKAPKVNQKTQVNPEGENQKNIFIESKKLQTNLELFFHSNKPTRIWNVNATKMA